jgi:glycosyltransferase involved in cell wall biosynthesis
MKIAALTITHERPAFMQWLIWNFEKQTYEDKHLIIIDSSQPPLTTKRNDVTVVCTDNNNVAYKRNLAMQAARDGGYDAIAWFDDDDWSHPKRLAYTAQMMADHPEAVMAGTQWSWFVDVFSQRVKRFCDRKRPLFTGSLYRLDGLPLFDETIARGSDTDWLNRIEGQIGGTFEPLLFMLCHDTNMGNTTAAHGATFNRGLGDIVDLVGRRDYGRTLSNLNELRRRLK